MLDLEMHSVLPVRLMQGAQDLQRCNHEPRTSRCSMGRLVLNVVLSFGSHHEKCNVMCSTHYTHCAMQMPK